MRILATQAPRREMVMWNFPYKKIGTASTALIILLFVLLYHNLGISRQGTARSSSADTNLRAVDAIQDDSDARVTKEWRDDAVINEAAVENRVLNAHGGTNGFNPQCKMKKSIAFMKVQKAGSQTTACILQRFGYEYGLNFVLPKKCLSVKLGFPEGMTNKILMKQNVDEYNLLVYHTVYDRDKLHKLMAPDTQFIAILREPFSHLKSCFFYFHRDKRFALLTEKNPLGKYLDNPWLYEGSKKAKKKPVSMTKNLQSYVLGWKDRFNQDREEVRKFISQLDSDFPLILILEYFDASVVLLRRLMCWSFYNILYDSQPRNEQTYSKPQSMYTEQQLQNHRNSSWVDYQLYDHFNRSLWSKIQAAGPDFQDELEAFQQLNHDVNSYCAGKPKKKKTFPGSKWNGPVEIKPQFCEDLKKERFQWDIKICYRAHAYGKDTMLAKEAGFQKYKENRENPVTTATKAKGPQRKSDQILNDLKKRFPGVDLIAVMTKSGIPVSKVVTAIKQGQYTVDGAAQRLKTLIQNTKQ
ncbi:galactose-3-O-sulfotransferase 2-like isoform X3 [Branchiostoma floridae x Branchiostoma japonicum]